MKYCIPLSCQRTESLIGKHVVEVSLEDFEYLSQWNWSLLTTPSGCYAYRKSTITDPEPAKANIYLHRVVAERMAGKLQSKRHIDHVDGNTLCCTRDNLRITTPAQNRMNSKPNKNNTSGYRGVTKVGDVYHARIGNNHLGTFQIAEEAAAAYNTAAKARYGEYSKRAQNPLPPKKPIAPQTSAASLEFA